MTTAVALWPSRIMVAQCDAPDMNRALLADVFGEDVFDRVMFDKARQPLHHNLMLKKTPAMSWLFDQVRAAVDAFVGHHGGSTDGLARSFFTFANTERAGASSLPHAHYDNQMVVTYYPQVERAPGEDPAAGQLVFHDPRARFSRWMNGAEPYCYPVSVGTGTLVCFPGWLEHSTTSFRFDGSVKRAIVTNVDFRKCTSAMVGEEVLRDLHG